MITWTAHQYYGSGRPWIATITGTDSKYGLSRAFLSADETSRSRSGATGDKTWQINEPGLYECRFPRRNKDDGGFRLVWPSGGDLKWCSIDVARAKAVAKLMHSGETFETARIATRPAKTA